jgi:hypothetical protein
VYGTHLCTHPQSLNVVTSFDAEFSDLVDLETHHPCVFFYCTVLLNHLLVFSILCTYLTVRVGLRMVWHFLRHETPISYSLLKLLCVCVCVCVCVFVCVFVCLCVCYGV